MSVYAGRAGLPSLWCTLGRAKSSDRWIRRRKRALSKGSNCRYSLNRGLQRPDAESTSFRHHELGPSPSNFCMMRLLECALAGFLASSNTNFQSRCPHISADESNGPIYRKESYQELGLRGILNSLRVMRRWFQMNAARGSQWTYWPLQIPACGGGGGGRIKQ